MMFYFFGCIGLIWAVVWIVIYRDETTDTDPQLLLNPTVSNFITANHGIWLNNKVIAWSENLVLLERDLNLRPQG